MKTFKEFINETEMQKAAREKIKREKEADKLKHDRMMDTARRRDTVTANQKEEVEQADEACWDGYKKVGMKKKGKKMVPDCVPEERSAQDSDIKDREGTQPAAYHKGLKKATKAKRDAHFKKHGKKADDDASAYKDAPGDKEAREKGMRKSKYTKFVDNMMDETVMHVSFQHIDGSKHEKPALNVLKKHEKAGSISYNGSTDKGILFKVHKKHHVNTINHELKKHMTSLSEEDKGFAAKAKKSGISVSTLRKVYNRGVAAWKTGHRPGTTPQQWGHARVNAFIAKKKKGGLNHDKDLA